MPELRVDIERTCAVPELLELDFERRETGGDVVVVDTLRLEQLGRDAIQSCILLGTGGLGAHENLWRWVEVHRCDSIVMEERSATLRPNRSDHTHKVFRVGGIPRVTFIVTAVVAPSIVSAPILVIAGPSLCRFILLLSL